MLSLPSRYLPLAVSIWYSATHQPRHEATHDRYCDVIRNHSLSWKVATRVLLWTTASGQIQSGRCLFLKSSVVAGIIRGASTREQFPELQASSCFLERLWVKIWRCGFNWDTRGFGEGEDGCGRASLTGKLGTATQSQFSEASQSTPGAPPENLAGDPSESLSSACLSPPLPQTFKPLDIHACAQPPQRLQRPSHEFY